MNIEQEWQNMNNEIQLQSSNKSLPGTAGSPQSQSLLSSLLFKLKWKMRWIRIIDIPILIISFFVNTHLQVLLVSVFLSYELFCLFAVREFHKITTRVDYTANTRQVLQANLDAIKSILKIEYTWGYIFLPLAGPVGLLAYSLYQYPSIQLVVTSPNFPLKIAVMALMGIPMFLLAKRMNNSIFKQPLQELQQKINELENGE